MFSKSSYSNFELGKTMVIRREKFLVFLSSVLVSSCSNLTSDQISSVSKELKATTITASSLDSSIQKISLDGTVYDSQTRTRLDNVIIEINNQITKTDNIGHYFLSDVLQGDVTITVKKNGFSDLTEKHNLKDKTQTINFNLKPQVSVNNSPKPQTTSFTSITPPSNETNPFPKLKQNESFFYGYLEELGTFKPVPSVLLRIGNLTTTTDSNGFFNFSDPPLGTQIIYEYLNGLDKPPSTHEIEVKKYAGYPSVNTLLCILKEPVPPKVIPESVPKTIIPVLNEPVSPTVTPELSFMSQDGLIGIWEFTFKSKTSSNSHKSIFAFKNSPTLPDILLTTQVSKNDELNALNGKVNLSYFNQSYDNPFMFNGSWTQELKSLNMLHTNYNSVFSKTGEDLYLIIYLIAKDNDTLVGEQTRPIITDTSKEDYTVIAKRLRNNFSLIDNNGTILETYKAKFN